MLVAPGRGIEPPRTLNARVRFHHPGCAAYIAAAMFFRAVVRFLIFCFASM